MGKFPLHDHYYQEHKLLDQSLKNKDHIHYYHLF